MLDEGKSCQVIVPDGQLSLAIGKEGQNARLAAKLTGYKIDIKSESAAAEETEADEMSLFEDEDDLFADEAPETEAAEPAVEADAEEPEELVDEAEEAQDAETVENSEESVENWEEPEAVATDETAEETQAEEL